jgi:probable HAF family extracellular repeat protein
MRIATLVFLAVSLALSVFGQSVQSQVSTFNNLSGPFPLLPLGISSQGIVGYVCCQSDGIGDADLIAFVQQRAKFDPSFALLGLPLAGSSFATGVNSSGTVVGGFCTPQDGCGESTSAEHGFSTDLTGQGLQQIDFPGTNIATVAAGINDDGVIVGSYCPGFAACSAPGSKHGFEDNNGVFTTIDYPGARFTSLYGINNSDEIVGTYTTTAEHAFTLLSGEFTTIDPPGAKSAIAESINSSGVIVGTFTDTNNQSHGFKYASGVFTTIDYPKANFTSADGIDDIGEIVGSYRIGNGAFHGYLAK